ncbi:hypothetical protein [Phenylobacterium sp.]|uniref:hypothetical protein n=1 Tax=Phenylobacterium sp. TaxID=1871053 RepID=UPI002DF6BFA2|nr:hypothetical protein [Phenylobacterium sp.]
MTRLRIRRAVPALAAAACALNLAACDLGANDARLAARQAQVDPPRLWLAEVMGPAGTPARQVQVCADQTLRDGFARAEPEVNHQPCRATSQIVSKPGLYALRCEAVGQSFAVTVTSRGDMRRDFTVRYALTPLDTGRASYVNTLRYRLLGPCPTGWRIGDQAPPRRPRVVNALG